MNAYPTPWECLSKLGLNIHFYNLNDEKLKAGDKICEPYIKHPCEIDIVEPERDDIICNAVGCNIIFSSLSELEAHQQARHTHVCATCHTILPSHHLLDRHILETHDSFFELLAQKKPMFACLLEFCPEVFQTPLERKEHCLKKHKFPPDFRYDLQFRKLKRHKSKVDASKVEGEKKVKHVSKQSSQPPTQARFEYNPDEMEGIMTSEEMSLDSPKPKPKISNKATVPKLISFGAGVPRGFATNKSRGKHWHQRGKSSNFQMQSNQIDMSEMNKVLNEMET